MSGSYRGGGHIRVIWGDSCRGRVCNAGVGWGGSYRGGVMWVCHTGVGWGVSYRVGVGHYEVDH